MGRITKAAQFLIDTRDADIEAILNQFAIDWDALPCETEAKEEDEPLPHTPTLKDVEAGAERAYARIQKWPKWKRDLSLLTSKS